MGNMSRCTPSRETSGPWPPSRPAILSISSSSETCSRNATLLFLISSLYLLTRITRPQHADTEIASGHGEVAQIEGDQPVGLAIDRRLQHHLVTRVLQPRTPPEVHMHRDQDLRQGIENFTHLLVRQPACIQVLRTSQYRSEE